MPHPSSPVLLHAPAAVGDVLDRLTILAVKVGRLGAASARANAARELELLAACWGGAGLGDWRADPDTPALSAVNAELWQVEDELRALDAAGEFGPPFVALARRVYHLNDRRAGLKRAVNERRRSALVEEKQHPAYPRSLA